METKVFNKAVKELGLDSKTGGAIFSSFLSNLDNLLDGECWERYLQEHGMDVLVRVLCLCSLAFAYMYDEDDYKVVSIGPLEEESILAATVLLAWLRKVRPQHGDVASARRHSSNTLAAGRAFDTQRGFRGATAR